MLKQTMAQVSFKRKKNWLIIGLGIVTLPFMPVLSMLIKDSFLGNLTYKINAYPQVYLYSFLDWKIWIIRIIAIIVTYDYSTKLLRKPIYYTMTAILSPPLSLILLGTSDYRVEDSRIKKLVKEKRRLLRNSNTPREKMEDEFQSMLHEDISDLIRTDKIDSLKRKIKEHNLSPKEHKQQLDLLYKNIDLNLSNINDTSAIKCVACGAKYYQDSLFCPDCEISLK
jgi:hypothetical protein